MEMVPFTRGSYTRGLLPQISFATSLITVEAPRQLMIMVAPQVDFRRGQYTENMNSTPNRAKITIAMISVA